jgi:hypothetical protein
MPEAGSATEERPEALWADARRWPVLAWLRLKVPEPPAPLLLTRGPPPPPSPPVDWLTPEEVATDPSVRLFTFHERTGEGIVRYVWQGSEPEQLLAEYRAPRYIARLTSAQVRAFWAVVKQRLAELGPLPVEGADPRP